MLSLGLVTWLIILILLGGDIEPNPGPVVGFLLNTRSVKSVNYERNKLVELQALVTIKNAKIVCLTETWLNADINDSEILPTDQFNIYRRDRDGTGGGVLAAIHSSIVSKPRPDLAPASSQHIEILVIEINMSRQRKMALVTVYNPPKYTNILQSIQISRARYNYVKRYKQYTTLVLWMCALWGTLIFLTLM
jgi:hypothetical protein